MIPMSFSMVSASHPSWLYKSEEVMTCWVGSDEVQSWAPAVTRALMAPSTQWAAVRMWSSAAN